MFNVPPGVGKTNARVHGGPPRHGLYPPRTDKGENGMRSNGREHDRMSLNTGPPGSELFGLPTSPDPTLSWADLLLVTNASGRIAAANGDWHARTGLKAENLAGLWLRDIMDGQAVETLQATARTGVRQPPMSIRLIARNGDHLDAYAAAVACAPLNGACIGLRLTPNPATADEPLAASDRSIRTELAHNAAWAIRAGTGALSILAVTVAGEPGTGPRDEWRRVGLLKTLEGRIQGLFPEATGIVRLNDNLYAVQHDPDCDIDEVCRQIAEAEAGARAQGSRLQAIHAPVAANVPAGTDTEALAKAIHCLLARLCEVTSFSPADFDANVARLLQESIADVHGFEQMLDGEGFGVVFHPVYNAVSGRLLYLEALCRFHADQGASPFRRLAFAEQAGLVHLFDAAMVRHILKRMTERTEHPPTSSVAINISAASLENPSFAGLLEDALQTYAVPAEQVVFEITQAERIADIDAAAGLLRSLRRRGHRVCLDDLSAGSASFEYLSRLDVDYVKLDGGAIRRARGAAKGQAFVSALTDLCRRIGTQTIAEMIDEPDALDFVRNCGVGYVQGFLFGQPGERLHAPGYTPPGVYFDAIRRP